MSARKFSNAPCGTWGTDSNGVPCFDLDQGAVPAARPLRPYQLSTGHLVLDIDWRGRVRMYAFNGDTTHDVTGSPPRALSAFYVQVSPQDAPSRQLVFPVDALPGDSGCAIRWGIGYAVLRGTLELAEGPVHLSVTLATPKGANAVVAEVVATPEVREPVTLDIAIRSDVSPPGIADAQQQAGEQAVFARSGVAMFTDLPGEIGDAFLAGDADWQSDHGLTSLILHRAVTCEPGSTDEEKGVFLFGCRRNCTIDWIRQKHETATVERVREERAGPVASMRFRSLEKWEQEDCQWAAARLLGSMREAEDREHLICAPRLLTTTGSRIASRELLAYVLPLSHLDAGLAETNLRAVLERQTPSGRVPESNEHENDLFEPGTDRSDLEIWLLVATACFVSSTGRLGIFDTAAVQGAGSGARPDTVWERLLAAAQWIRERIGTGVHGLIRIGAADTNPMLNRTGCGGKGESVLNSAMLVYALHRLETLARQRKSSADEFGTLTEWRRELAAAVGHAFAEKWFARAYTDGGRPVGTPADGRMFADVQAWAVLARGGRARERDMALDAVVKMCRLDTPPMNVCEPFPVRPPRDVSALALPRGEGPNGGTSPAVAAWLVWALADSGRYEQARRICESAAPRRMMDVFDLEPPGSTDIFGYIASRLSAAGAGRVDPALENAVPDVDLFAWQHFAVSRMLEPNRFDNQPET